MFALFRLSALLLFIGLPLFMGLPASALAQSPHSDDAATTSILQQENLVAWCIVPFDAAKRTPAERAQMLLDLGIRRCAYDWRAEHVPTFEQEILEYREHGIELFAFWGGHPEAYRLFEKHDLHPQIWMMPPNIKNGTQEQRVQQTVQQMLPAARETQRLGCKLSLYNHGGWAGEPENLVSMCRLLHEQGFDHVGITYNFHHGHDHIDNWKQSFNSMRPFLHCLNLNGMVDNANPKILGIGKGQHEVDMIRVVMESDYQGPIGILDHRSELDAKESLNENIEGVRWVRHELQLPGSGGAKPKTPAPPTTP